MSSPQNFLFLGISLYTNVPERTKISEIRAEMIIRLREVPIKEAIQ
jgi:hypothetical protein